MTTSLPVEQFREIAIEKVRTLDDGPSLAPVDRALIELAVATSVTALDPIFIDNAIAKAFEVGSSSAQIQEIISLVAGLGVHSLMVGETRLFEAARRAGETIATSFDEWQSQLWNKFVGDSDYWNNFEHYVPGFLRSMLLLSPDQFESFFHFCAVPWRGKSVAVETKELASLACDASPTHRFMPGFLFHLDMAVAAGIGRRAIMETLDIAAAAPLHRGTD